VAGRKKNGRTFFDRPKPIMGCSANGRRRINYSAQKTTPKIQI